MNILLRRILSFMRRGGFSNVPPMSSGLDAQMGACSLKSMSTACLKPGSSSTRGQLSQYQRNISRMTHLVRPVSKCTTNIVFLFKHDWIEGEIGGGGFKQRLASHQTGGASSNNDHSHGRQSRGRRHPAARCEQRPAASPITKS